MSTLPTTSNIDAALRAQLEYYGDGRYELAEQAVTASYVDHEAPPGTPPGPEGRTRCCGGYAAASTTCRMRSSMSLAMVTGSRFGSCLAEPTPVSSWAAPRPAGRSRPKPFTSTGSTRARSLSTGPSATTWEWPGNSGCSNRCAADRLARGEGAVGEHLRRRPPARAGRLRRRRLRVRAWLYAMPGPRAAHLRPLRLVRLLAYVQIRAEAVEPISWMSTVCRQPTPRGPA